MKSNENYNLHYKSYHDGSSENYENMNLVYKNFINKKLKNNYDYNILDIGSGIGLFLFSLLKNGYKNIKGIDISESQISTAKKMGLPCDHVSDTIQYLKNSENTFDFIFMLDVLEHIEISQLNSLLLSCKKALKHGGTIIIQTPNANSVFSSRYRYIDMTHNIIFTEDTLNYLLLESGFNNIKIGEYFTGQLPIWFPRLSLHSLLFTFFYYLRRLEAIAYFGVSKGKKIPITLNILVEAKSQ